MYNIFICLELNIPENNLSFFSVLSWNAACHATGITAKHKLLFPEDFAISEKVKLHLLQRADTGDSFHKCFKSKGLLTENFTIIGFLIYLSEHYKWKRIESRKRAG